MARACTLDAAGIAMMPHYLLGAGTDWSKCYAQRVSDGPVVASTGDWQNRPS
jgi:hypothetical protein